MSTKRGVYFLAHLLLWRLSIFRSPHPIVNIIADQDSAWAFCEHADR